MLVSSSDGCCLEGEFGAILFIAVPDILTGSEVMEESVVVDSGVSIKDQMAAGRKLCEAWRSAKSWLGYVSLYGRMTNSEACPLTVNGSSHLKAFFPLTTFASIE